MQKDFMSQGALSSYKKKKDFEKGKNGIIKNNIQLKAFFNKKYAAAVISSLSSQVLGAVSCVPVTPNRNETTRPDLGEKNSLLHFSGYFFIPQILKFEISSSFPKGMFSPDLTSLTPPEGCCLGLPLWGPQAAGHRRGRVLCSSQTHQASFVWSQACEQGLFFQLSYWPPQFNVSEPLKLSIWVSWENPVWLAGAG